MGWERLLQPIQAIVCLGLTAWWIRRGIDAPTVGLKAIASVYLIFLLFNPIIWNYYWIGALLMLVVIIISEPVGYKRHFPNNVVLPVTV